jgi:hypothetical protein
MQKTVVLVAFLFLLAGIEKGTAQSNTTAGILPKLNIGLKLNGPFSLNLQAESRNIYFESRDNGWQNLIFDRAEFAGFLSYKAGAGTKVSLGYHLQFRNNQWSHRAIQQLSLVQRLESSRLGHRFSLEENFGEQTIQSARLRYRIVWERALSGERIDAGEWYVKIGNEYLLVFEPDPSSLEIRFVPVFGYEFNPKNKLELGPDIRYNGIFETTKNLQLFASMAWYYLL